MYTAVPLHSISKIISYKSLLFLALVLEQSMMGKAWPWYSLGLTALQVCWQTANISFSDPTIPWNQQKNLELYTDIPKLPQIPCSIATNFLKNHGERNKWQGIPTRALTRCWKKDLLLRSNLFVLISCLPRGDQIFIFMTAEIYQMKKWKKKSLVQITKVCHHNWFIIYCLFFITL